MKKEKFITRGSKNLIRPRIKIKIKPEQNNLITNLIPNICEVTEQNSNINSNSKSNTNSKTTKEIPITNNSESTLGQKMGEKYIINNETNEDKDLESLLSELKTTLLQNNKSSKKEKNNEEDLNKNINKNINKNNNNCYLLYNFDNHLYEQKKDYLGANKLNIQSNDYDKGNEISQRVHPKKAKTHFKLEQIEKKANNISSLNKNIFGRKNLYSLNHLNLIKKLKNQINFGNSSKKEKSNLKNSISTANNIKGNCSSLYKKKNIILSNYANTSKNKNSIPILDKYIGCTKKNKKLNKDKKIKSLKSPTISVNNGGKNLKASFYNNIRLSSKSEINTPKGFKLNKTINFDINSKNIINKINLLKNTNSKQKIGELYLKNKSKQFRNEKNKIQLINYKTGKNKSNPFDFNSPNNKSPIFKKINNYLDSFFEKTEMKRSFDNSCLHKLPKHINQISLESKNNRSIQYRNYSSSINKKRKYKYNNLKEYYSNLGLKKDRFHLNINKADNLFFINFDRKDNKSENKDKKKNSIKKKLIKYNKSVRNIEINL
jgi:hypothetical protein